MVIHNHRQGTTFTSHDEPAYLSVPIVSNPVFSLRTPWGPLGKYPCNPVLPQAHVCPSGLAHWCMSGPRARTPNPGGSVTKLGQT